MTTATYHYRGKAENKTVCGRPIEVAGKVQFILANPKKDPKHGVVCGRCKALLASANAKALDPATIAKKRGNFTPHKQVMKDLTAHDQPAAKKEHTPRTPALAALGEKMPKALEVTFKGVEHKATVLEDGRIALGQGDEPEIYNSPSRAGKAVAGREIDGWKFWSYRKEDGTLEKIDALRNPEKAA